jgi:hypothetical protein
MVAVVDRSTSLQRTLRNVRAEAVRPPAEQLTVTGQEPRVVRVPIFQVQLTPPELDAVFGPRPAAWDGPDLYSTTIMHEALPRVRCAIERAREPARALVDEVHGPVPQSPLAPIGGARS